MSSSCIKYICQNLPVKTDRLNFSGCQKHMNDKRKCRKRKEQKLRKLFLDVADLVKTCPDLHELDLSDCTALTGQAVQEISSLENLTFLALSRCYLIPYRSFLLVNPIKLNSTTLLIFFAFLSFQNPEKFQSASIFGHSRWIHRRRGAAVPQRQFGPFGPLE